jgi:exoribonuclease R
MATHSDDRQRPVLDRIASRAMQTYGFLADFSADALKELEAEQIADRAENSPAKDLRHLLWASIDNDDSLDLDQLISKRSNKKHEKETRR